MSGLDKREAEKDIRRAILQNLEKRGDDPTWITNLEIDEFELRPQNVIYTVLSKMGYPIRYESTATDMYGRKIKESIAVHVDDSKQKKKVENIRNAVLEDDVFKAMIGKSIRRKARALESPAVIEERVRQIIERKLEGHPDWKT